MQHGIQNVLTDNRTKENSKDIREDMQNLI